MPKLNWPQVRDDLLKLAQSLIKINTTNPPGNEMEAVRFIANFLNHNGLDSQIWVSAENRGNLYAVLKGNGNKRPVILLSHLDVVPAQESEWEVPPFSGIIKDGYLWGRGAIDMKSLAAIHLITFVLLSKYKKNLSRDVILLAVADEEAGAKYGAQWVIENHPESIAAEYLLTEGGHGQYLKGRPVYSCQTAEKGVFWLKLKTSGPPGHASMPHTRNCLLRLNKAITRLLGDEPEIKIIPAMQEYFSRLAGSFPEEEDFYRHPLAECHKAHLSKLMEEDRSLYAQLHNTISPTIFTAGTKINVIPSYSEAFLDCRLLPGENPEEFLAALKSKIDDPEIQIEVVENSPASSSPMETEIFKILEKNVKKENPEAILVPYLSPGGTDSRFFRRKGLNCYGFEPFILGPEEISRMHGVNERISLQNLEQGMKIFWNLMDEITG